MHCENESPSFSETLVCLQLSVHDSPPAILSQQLYKRLLAIGRAVSPRCAQIRSLCKNYLDEFVSVAFEVLVLCVFLTYSF